jgi:flagellar M-ring protein FliF
MATDNLPAEAVDQLPAEAGGAEQGLQSNEALPSAMDASDINPVMMGFNKLTIVRQVGLLIGFASILALGIAVVFWSQ